MKKVRKIYTEYDNIHFNRESIEVFPFGKKTVRLTHINQYWTVRVLWEFSDPDIPFFDLDFIRTHDAMWGATLSMRVGIRSRLSFGQFAETHYSAYVTESNSVLDILQHVYEKYHMSKEELQAYFQRIWDARDAAGIV